MITFDSQSLEMTLHILGNLLADRGHYYEVVAIGGGSLLILKLLARTTKDLDLVALVKDGKLTSANPLPLPLVEATQEVATALKLNKDWLNIGPSALLEGGLPQGFLTRLHTYTQIDSKVGFWLRRTSPSLDLDVSLNLFKLSCFAIASLTQICGSGFAKLPTFETICVYHYKGITLHCADRLDQICFKLYASVDQGPKSKHFADLLSLKPSSKELTQAKDWCLSHDVSEIFSIELDRALEAIHVSD